jgi:hypothetical protein
MRLNSLALLWRRVTTRKGNSKKKFGKMRQGSLPIWFYLSIGPCTIKRVSKLLFGTWPKSFPLYFHQSLPSFYINIFHIYLGVSLCEVLELVSSFSTSPSSSKMKSICIYYCVFDFTVFIGLSF